MTERSCATGTLGRDGEDLRGGEVVAEETRILSVQSHVVSGYVGNKAAIFPLQLLGLEVDFINTVQFSNHTGYAKWAGERTTGEQVRTLFETMDYNGLLCHSHVLTGYIGRVEVLRAVLDALRRMRETNPDITFFCDPVMGDDGHLYVPKELVEVYRDEALPLANFVTPNQFECEQLTGQAIKTEEDAIAACDLLHEKGVSVVVVTSLFYGAEGEIILLASQQKRNNSKQREKATEEDGEQTKKAERWRIRIKSFPEHFSGNGDLCSALLLAWSILHPDNLALACEKAVAGVHVVLQNTLQYHKERQLEEARMEKEEIEKETEKGRRGRSWSAKDKNGAPKPMELRLIQSRNEILNPRCLPFRAERIS
ncbi:pyridoxal kinase [Balamuthia mandrillaris]